MIYYFWEGLKPSIKIEIEQQDRVSTSFKKMVQKAVNAKANVGLRSSTMVWDSVAYCLRGLRPSHNTFSKVQTQGSKDLSHFEKTKPKDPKSALSRDNVAKLSKKNDRKDKKKRFRGQKRDHTGEQKEQIPAININTIDVSKNKKKRRDIN